MPAPSSPVRIDVAVGEPFQMTARKLEDAGLVPSALALRGYARWRNLDRQIQQGAYQFDQGLPPIAVLEKMVNGEAMVARVTIPEGLRAREIAAVLERSGLGTVADYDKMFSDVAFIHSLRIPADSPEGYLFPDTYGFSPLTPPVEVVQALVKRFHDVCTPEIVTEAERGGLSLHQLVTLASVIEKETGNGAERALVAAVFRNRMRLGMPLQADSTVIYGVEEFDGNLTRAHLETPTAYNTYSFPGLPPGPIASPGRASLLAALRPSDGDFLYFVSRNDGTHEFTTNLADHNRAVNRWQRSRRRPTG
jgi:UPF0755 protein